MTWTLRLLSGHIVSQGTARSGRPSLGSLCSRESKSLMFYYHAITAKLGCWCVAGRRGAAPVSCPQAQVPQVETCCSVGRRRGCPGLGTC